MVTSSRRIAKLTNKTKLLIYHGSDKVDPSAVETVLWDQDNAAGADSKHQHIGPSGVENGELLQHHLQAALSSASLLASSTKLSSPVKSTKQESTPIAALNYHIPTPDATGLVADKQFAQLYQKIRYNKPYTFIRFSDTVEESCCGWGGLGYCMDDADVKWLQEFNSKAEGSSGDIKNEKEGRAMRAKGKEKDKDAPAALVISEDMFEYVMGILEKYTEDNVPMLHTDLSLLPSFSAVETMFSTPISPSFLPNNEVPKEIGDLRFLTRIARNIYPHWKSRREKRQGRPIVPPLNFDETNNNDPYVCFRRRDTRATRKTRRTDNFSIEQFQKLQYELRDAYSLAQSVLRRETEKKAFFQASREEWECKWKLFETKRRWPSLGMTQQEEELITGRPIPVIIPIQVPTTATHSVIPSAQSTHSHMRKRLDKDREEKAQRDKYEAQRQAEKSTVFSGRSSAPDALKEKLLAMQQRLDDMMTRRKERDIHWDDSTDNSYQPLLPSYSSHYFRSLFSLDPSRANIMNDRDQGELIRPECFRLRRGRGGVLRLDRKTPLYVHRRGSPPTSSLDYPAWLFPSTRPTLERKRPRSVDDVEPVERKKQKNPDEIWRYDVDKGGALGVGMGLEDDQDRVIIDDLESKYIRHRIGLLQEGDVEKLRPDHYFLEQTAIALKEMVDAKPPLAPIFQKPPPPQANPQLLAAHLQQQQLLAQQQQMEQFQRFQLMAQQQALVQQQQAAMAQAQAQAQANQGDQHMR
nr:hypothetical protein L203_01053 [Cryptococcus depauperatus CBS 7841]